MVIPHKNNVRFQYQMMGVTCGAGTANPYGMPEFTPNFRVA